MLGRHRPRILRVAAKLQGLYRRPDNLALLEDLQHEILAALIAGERNIVRLQNGRAEIKQRMRSRGFPKSEAESTKQLLGRYDSRIAFYQSLLSLWRAFGDGIAFTYIEKWPARALASAHASCATQRPPLRLLDRAAVDHRLIGLRRHLAQGIPAVLPALTNCAPYGDLCLLGSRLVSQDQADTLSDSPLQEIRSIHDYLSNGGVKHTRDPRTGEKLPVRRLFFPLSGIHYRKLFDRGIAAARKGAVFVANPEPGLRFIATTRLDKKSLDQAFAGFSTSAVWMLNEYKERGDWQDYYPCSLSIRSPENLYAFLEGKIYLLVAVNHQALQKVARNMGIELEEVPDKLWPYKLRLLDSDVAGFECVSNHFVSRMLCELMSWKWWFALQHSCFLSALKAAGKNTAVAVAGSG